MKTETGSRKIIFIDGAKTEGHFGDIKENVGCGKAARLDSVGDMPCKGHIYSTKFGFWFIQVRLCIVNRNL